MLFFKHLKVSVVVILAAFSLVAGSTPYQDLSDELQQANELLSQQQYSQAYPLFFQHSKQNPLAQFNLGLFELYGWGRAKNTIAACHWFEQAAQQTIPMAQQLLADCYRDGTHKKADFSVAQQWYLRAIKNGLADAGCQLGKIYIQGELIKKEINEGIRLCEQAGAGGSVTAQLYLAEQFYAGDTGLSRDIKRSLYWYQAAAMANNAEAQFAVAQLLNSGEAGVSNFDTALTMAESAAAKGFEPAYLLTAKLYMSAPIEPQTQHPTEINLAKSYLWTQAVIKGESSVSDKRIAANMLEQIESLMPKTWAKSLDKKVHDHLERVQSDRL